MSGRIFTLFGKLQFDFSFLATSGVQTITMRRALPIIPFYDMWLGLRVHNVNIQSGSFVLDLLQTLPSREDPQEFTYGPAALSVTVGSGTSAPSLLTDSRTHFGPYLKVILRATQGTGGNRLYGELSAVLLARIR